MSSKSGHLSMQLRVLQCLQTVSAVGHPAHADPLALHSRYLAQRTERRAPGLRLASVTVRLALTSLVTVDGETPILRAMERAESPALIPSSITSLCSLHRCFPLDLAMMPSVSAR